MYISESIGIETIFLKHITLLSNRFLKKRDILILTTLRTLTFWSHQLAFRIAYYNP